MEKIPYYEAKAKVLCAYSGFLVRRAYYLPDGYLFVMYPWNRPRGEFYEGAFLKVAYNGALHEYSLVKDPEEFKEAMKHQIE